MKSQLLVFIAVILLGVSGAQAMPIVYKATLLDLSNASPGTGSATAEYDPILHTLSVDASFSGLLGNTTASHIHCCVAVPGTGNAGVATSTPSFPGFPLGVTSGIYNHLFDLTQSTSFNGSFVTANGGVAGAELALANGLSDGRAYFNIHTNFAPGGEIRGFLTAVPTVPEPATLSLLGLGIASLLAARHKRRV